MRNTAPGSSVAETCSIAIDNGESKYAINPYEIMHGRHPPARGASVSRTTLATSQLQILHNSLQHKESKRVLAADDRSTRLNQRQRVAARQLT